MGNIRTSAKKHNTKSNIVCFCMTLCVCLQVCVRVCVICVCVRLSMLGLSLFRLGFQFTFVVKLIVSYIDIGVDPC